MKEVDQLFCLCGKNVVNWAVAPSRMMSIEIPG
jgi:hypothetical protein